MRFVAEKLAAFLSIENLFDEANKLQGEVFREVEARRTLRIEIGGAGYFLKLHFGVGWAEIFKNLLQLKQPVLGAKNELLAARHLHQLEIQTLNPVAYCADGLNPARIRSCIITEALDNTQSLEQLMQSKRIDLVLKRKLVAKLASIAATMHDNGINHRDFYLCHFLLDMSYFSNNAKFENHDLSLIDLHRAQIRAITPGRWRVKDVSGLLFSSVDVGLTRGDLYRFMKIYSGKSLRLTLVDDASFWRKVAKKASRLYLKDHGQHSSFLQMLVLWTNTKYSG